MHPPQRDDPGRALASVGHLVVVLALLGIAETVVWYFHSGRGCGYLSLTGGVIAAYSLDRVIDAREHERRLVWVRLMPALIGGSAMVVCGLWRAPEHLWLVGVLAVLGGGYVPLKRFVPKGVLTAGAWAMGTVWLPGAVTPTFREGMPLALCVLLIVGANAVLCDALDVDEDRRMGVRGLGPWLGAARVSMVASGLALCGAAAAVGVGAWPLAAAAVPLAVAGVVRGVPSVPRLRRAALDLTLALPGLVCLFLSAGSVKL